MSNDRGTQCTIHTFHAAATNVQKYLRVYIQHSVHCKDYMEHTAVDESDFIKIKVPHELQSQNAKLAVGKTVHIAKFLSADMPKQEERRRVLTLTSNSVISDSKVTIDKVWSTCSPYSAITKCAPGSTT